MSRYMHRRRQNVSFQAPADDFLPGKNDLQTASAIRAGFKARLPNIISTKLMKFGSLLRLNLSTASDMDRAFA